MVIDGDLLIAVDIFSCSKVFEGAVDVDQEFLIVLGVFVMACSASRVVAFGGREMIVSCTLNVLQMGQLNDIQVGLYAYRGHNTVTVAEQRLAYGCFILVVD